MSKGLEGLERYKDSYIEIGFGFKAQIKFGETHEYKLIENELRTLEIIKEKGLSINEIAFIKNGDSWETYVETMKELYWGDERLDKVLKTKEDYDLLKEVLL